MLEKTLQSPLDCKEVKPVSPKGNKPWKFIGSTDAEDEAPILWPPDAKSWLIWKDHDAGRNWGQEEKRLTEDEMAGSYHRLNGHELGWTPGVGDGQGAAVHQVTKSWTRLSDLTELCNVSTVLPRTKHICFMYYEKWIVWFQRVCIWICIWVKCSLIKLALSKKKMSVKIHVNNLKFLYHPLLRKHLKAKTFKSINKQTNKQTKTHIRS